MKYYITSRYVSRAIALFLKLCCEKLRHMPETSPPSLAVEIEQLVNRYGSDDKLAKDMGTSRQTVIGWRIHGRVPGPRYRAALIERGVPAAAFIPKDYARRLGALERRLAKDEADLRALRELLASTLEQRRDGSRPD